MFDFKIGIENRNGEFPISGLTYIPNYISKIEHDSLISKIDSNTWSTEMIRRVQHYGYKYNYKQRRIDISMKISDLPDWLDDIASELKEKNILTEKPDQVIINEYLPGQGISTHIDCEPCFTDEIVSISLGSRCIMDITKGKTIKYLLDVGSLILLKGEARYEWSHGIKPIKTDDYFGQKINRRRRISLTFRKVIL